MGPATSMHLYITTLLSFLTLSVHHLHATPTVDHVVLMRFCLVTPTKEYIAASCETLLDIFEATAWRSLLMQEVPFRVLAYYPPDLASQTKERIEDLLSHFVYGMYPASGYFIPGSHNELLAEALAGFEDFVTQVSADVRITTKIDMDDYMHIDTLKHIQEFVAFPSPLGFNIVNQLKGWTMHFESKGENVVCSIAPFESPFIALGQSFINRNSSSLLSMLDFPHTRNEFLRRLQDLALITATTPLHEIEQTLLYLPLPRGYIYVRHQLSRSRGFLEAPAGSRPCDLMSNELHEHFGIRTVDIVRLSSIPSVSNLDVALVDPAHKH